MEPFRILVPATDENFDEAAYLAANRDVAKAVAKGTVESGRVHFDVFGRNEGRQLRRPIPVAMKAAKLAHVRPLLGDGTLVAETPALLDCLPQTTRDELDLDPTENVSAHEYDDRALALIERHRDGLVLDCGAGLRSTYYPNVVNYEIVDYDTTDVLGAAERLPFADESFDAVLSLNVLEHVKDPFVAAREIMRVMKPGAELMAVAPFLQPLHGYPHHYYNMTAQGLSNLFEPLEARSLVVEGAMHPAYALGWILKRYADGLSREDRDRLEELRISDVIRDYDAPLHQHPLPISLSGAALSELASAHALLAVKPVRAVCENMAHAKMSGAASRGF